MTSIQETNNTQTLNMYDKLITAFNESGLSIADFSKATGISKVSIKTALSKNINGYFTVTDIVNLSKYLNIKLYDLF